MRKFLNGTGIHDTSFDHLWAPIIPLLILDVRVIDQQGFHYIG